MPLIDLVNRLEKPFLECLLKAAPEELQSTQIQHWPEETFVCILCDALGLPCYPIAADNVDQNCFEKMEEVCTKYRFLPLHNDGVLIQIGCLEPWSRAYLATLRRILRKEIRPVGITERDFDEAVAALSERKKLSVFADNASSEHMLNPPRFAWNFDPDNRNAGLATLAEIIEESHREDASDIHLEPFEDELSIRFRINNDLQPQPPIEAKYRDQILQAFKIKANIPVDDIKVIRRGRISTVTSVGKLDLRVECLPTQHGQKIVCRLLDPSTLSRFYGKLPFQGKQFDILTRSIERYKGLILVTGPTGSGKSTTLIGTITSLDLATLNVSTIEDPIEYSIKYLNQTDVSAAVSTSGEGKVTFPSALRSLLRQDPDVILVGEIRDLETMKIAIEGSQTGHLIFSTLHTNNCTETIKRILDMRHEAERIDAGSLGSALSCVVAQRLLEKLCPECAREIDTPPSARRWFEAYQMRPPEKVKTKRGCTKCRGGVRGRLPVFEVLEITDELRGLITSNFSEERFEQQWRAEGGVTLAEHGLALAAEGVVDYREVRSLIWNQAALSI